MIYNVDFNIASIAVLLFTIIYVCTRKGLALTTNRIYFYMLLCCLICAISDIACGYVNSPGLGYSTSSREFWNMVYMMVHNLTPYLLVRYVINDFGISKYQTRAVALIMAPPVIAVEIVLILNPLTRLGFSFDENGGYVRGPFYALFYVVAALYLVFAIELTVRYRSSISQIKQYILILLFVASILPIVIQIIYPYTPVECFSQSIGLLGILFTIEDKGNVVDQQTHIYNRFAFTEYAKRMFDSNDAQAIMVKISNLQYYNSTVGSQYVNDLIREVASWLDRVSNDMNCYYCGNGCFIIAGIHRAEEQVSLLKEEIYARFFDPWGRRSFQTMFPVQICNMRIPRDVSNLEQFLLLVDSVFTGKNSEEINASKAIGELQHRIKIEKAVNKAIKEGSFRVYYQPIWDRATGRVFSAEALLRLFDDELGFVPPDEFIPIAEKNGSILDIGAFVFNEVCKFYQEGQLQDIGIEYIEINLSVVQCMNRRLVVEFDRVLSKYHLSPERINLEITESAAAESTGTLSNTVHELVERGYELSLDDYGTGYSNFSYMFAMPFSIVKLDKSILWSALHPKTGHGEENAMVLLENSIKMLHEMHYKTLVEGVETVEQKILLEKLGCDLFQGFFFSKPVPEDTFIDFVKAVNA